MPEETTPLPAAPAATSTNHSGLEQTASLAPGTPSKEPADTTATATSIQEAPAGFQLLSVLGRGGMGVVFRAHDEALDREVAVKLLHERYADDAAGDSPATQRFLSEARITARLQHPGIPAVYQVGRCASGRPFLAMKLIRGETLDKLLAGKSPLNVLAVFEAICQAVGYAHAQEVIHRDLKPSNVMVGSFGEVQVMDWGLGKQLNRPFAGSTRSKSGEVAAEEFSEPLPATTANDADGSFTRDGSVIGSPAYMPPEQARGDVARIDERADVFGLGAILCVLLTGGPPFTGKDWGAVHQRALRGDLADAYARLQCCNGDPELVALCRRCLSVEPDDRPRNGKAVASEVAALRQAADERAQRAESERVRAEVAVSEQRKWWRLAYISAGLVCGALLIGIVGTTIGMLRAGVAQRAEAKRAIEESKAKELANEQRIKADEQRARAEGLRVKAEQQQAQAELARDSARQRYLLALEAFDQMVNGVQLKLTNRAGTQELRVELLKNARAGIQKLVAEGEAAEKPDFTLGWSYVRMGDVEWILGNTAAAEIEYQKGLELAEKLVADNPADRNAQQNRDECLQRLGKVQLKAGQTEAALRRFEQALENTRKGTSDLPGVPGSSPGDIAGLRLVATGLYHVGDAHYQMGNLQQALQAFQEEFAINQRLAAANPKDVVAQFDLGMAQERLGSVYRELAQYPKALGLFQQAMLIYQRLHNTYPKNTDYERSLFVCRSHLGQVQSALGDWKQAEFEYGQALMIIQRMAEADPRNMQLQRDRSIALESLADIALDQHKPDLGLKLIEQALTIRQRRATEDPRNSEAQRDLATAFEWLATCHLELGDLPKAVENYQRQQDIIRRLVKEDPDDAVTQRSLILCLSHLGHVAQKQFQFAAAEKFHQEQLELVERLLFADPKSNSAQFELVRLQYHMGELRLNQSDFAAARVWFQDCQTNLQKLNAAKRLQADERDWLAKIPHKLDTCDLGESALADIEFAFDQPDILVATVLMMRITGLLRLKRFDEAIATADRHAEWAREWASKQKKDPGMEFYLAYRGYAFCAIAVEPAERTPLIQKALELITEAKSYNVLNRHRVLFLRDTQFEPVWQHELFQPLMKEVRPQK